MRRFTIITNAERVYEFYLVSLPDHRGYIFVSILNDIAYNNDFFTRVDDAINTISDMRAEGKIKDFSFKIS